MKEVTIVRCSGYSFCIKIGVFAVRAADGPYRELVTHVRNTPL